MREANPRRGNYATGSTFLTGSLAIDIEEWAARYKYASQSVTLLNDYLAAKAKAEGGTLPVPLLTASTSHEPNPVAVSRPATRRCPR